ncbi:putative zinc protease [subsurface metagenome]
MLTNSLLDPQEIEKEKLVIRNELNLIEDNADDKGHELYLKQMWNGHPLSRRITGESSQIKEITAAGLQDFYKERFGLSNMVITAAGKINSEVILSRLQKVLKRDRTCRFHTLRKPPQRIRSWKIISGKFEQVHLFSGLCYALSGEIKEYFNELVFSTLFGESMSSRLFQRLREAEGLCYAVSTFRSYYSDTALWTIYANVVPESVSRLLDSLETELRRLLLEPPGRAEVGDAKSQLKGNFTLAKEDMENRMKRLLRQYVLTGQVLEHPETMSLLAAVSVEDVMSVIERLIKPENFNLLAYGNKKLKSLKKKKYCF